ncbi:MAG TPA: hypothetical protein VKE40_22885 [Gemmataceae bacterium]|nr:hypothetical protein [Gemmataceae bacterium]
MPRLMHFALAFGLMVAVTAIVSADGPRLERPKMEDPERAKLRRTIQVYRIFLEHLKRPMYCGSLEQVREFEDDLRALEFAYEQRLPVKCLRR